MEPQRRAVRLNTLVDMFKGRRAGYTTQELADATGMHVRSIQRDLITLQSEMGLPLEEDHGRWKLMRTQQLQPLELTLHEARALLIATRLFLRYSDESDPPAVTAIEKLARIMPDKVRPQIEAAARSIERRAFDPHFTRNLATVTDAWARGRMLRLSYRSAGRTRPHEVILHPYALEPSAAGFATYLIGYSESHGSVRTLKIERIVSAEMLPRSFILPDTFDIDRLLSSAWGIIWGEGEQVQLRFTSDVAWRVRESKWHPSQQLDDLPGGAVLLSVSVASMMELGRWVRSWGDRVEVLEPASLREELRVEAVRLARQYSAPPKKPRATRRATQVALPGQSRLDNGRGG
jgi:predicted DNA-binding transcriptional regulator YafY